MRRLNNLIEIYLPNSMNINGEVSEVPELEFEMVYNEIREILLEKCSGYSEREETGYFVSDGYVNEMKNTVMYAYFADGVKFNLRRIHTIINEGLFQKCSMICINHKAEIA